MDIFNRNILDELFKLKSPFLLQSIAVKACSKLGLPVSFHFFCHDTIKVFNSDLRAEQIFLAKEGEPLFEQNSIVDLIESRNLFEKNDPYRLKKLSKLAGNHQFIHKF